MADPVTPRLLALQSLRDKLRVAMGPLPDETVAELLWRLSDISKDGGWRWQRTHDEHNLPVLMVTGSARHWAEGLAFFDHELPDRSLDGGMRLVPPGWVSSAQEVMPGNRWRWSLTRWSDGTVVDPAMPSATAPLALLFAVVEARIAEEPK